VTLRFTLAKAQEIKVRIYNVAGREVRELLEEGRRRTEQHRLGRHAVEWRQGYRGRQLLRGRRIDFAKSGSQAQR
jgi:hypothetical protein